MTTRAERQADVQAFIDALSPVERHGLIRFLNERRHSLLVNATDEYAYDIEWLECLTQFLGDRFVTEESPWIAPAQPDER